jgi:hypothetical protein
MNLGSNKDEEAAPADAEDSKFDLAESGDKK